MKTINLILLLLIGCTLFSQSIHEKYIGKSFEDSICLETIEGYLFSTEIYKVNDWVWGIKIEPSDSTYEVSYCSKEVLDNLISYIEETTNEAMEWNPSKDNTGYYYAVSDYCGYILEVEGLIRSDLVSIKLHVLAPKDPLTGLFVKI